MLGARMLQAAAGVTGAVGDPYWSSVVSLLYFNGSNGSVTFGDETGKIWTPHGNAQISTAQSRFGGASGYFDGAGDFLSVSNSSDWAFGSGDFTVEAWLRPATPPGGGVNNDMLVFGGFPSTPMVFFLRNSDNAPALWDGIHQSTSSITPAAGAWSHVAWSRKSSTLRVFVGGLKGFEAIRSVNFSSTGTFRLGRDIGNRNYKGYIDSFRITKGVGRYISDFTPPAEPFPNS